MSAPAGAAGRGGGIGVGDAAGRGAAVATGAELATRGAIPGIGEAGAAPDEKRPANAFEGLPDSRSLADISSAEGPAGLR